MVNKLHGLSRHISSLIDTSFFDPSSGYTQLNQDTIIDKNIKKSGYDMEELKCMYGCVYKDPTIIIELLKSLGKSITKFLIIWTHMILVWSSNKEVLKKGISTRDKSEWAYPTQCKYIHR